MENFIVGLIVLAALGFSVRSFVRIFKGSEGCGCAGGCSCHSSDCDSSDKECCGTHQIQRKI